ncbi:hypothetical protein IE4803_CH02693 [Rhizobium etli bv. phaseoli str. IE4803]|nr:hypothetical protein IE4803_CH02693 [Rhizobium etli bv. phaseoli str. IE4803]
MEDEAEHRADLRKEVALPQAREWRCARWVGSAVYLGGPRPSSRDLRDLAGTGTGT